MEVQKGRWNHRAGVLCARLDILPRHQIDLVQHQHDALVWPRVPDRFFDRRRATRQRIPSVEDLQHDVGQFRQTAKVAQECSTAPIVVVGVFIGTEAASAGSIGYSGAAGTSLAGLVAEAAAFGRGHEGGEVVASAAIFVTPTSRRRLGRLARPLPLPSPQLGSALSYVCRLRGERGEEMDGAENELMNGWKEGLMDGWMDTWI